MVEYKYSSHPQHNDNEHRTEKLAHRMSHLLSYVHALHRVAVVAVDTVEALVHLILSAECLDDAESAE